MAETGFRRCRISKISNSVGRIDNFRDLVRKLSFLPTDLDIFDIRQHYICILFIFQRLIYYFLLFVTPTNVNLAIYGNGFSCFNDVMNHIDCGDLHMFPGFLTLVLTQLFFPKLPTTFLTCFCRGDRRKYAGKNIRFNRGSNSQPLVHESDTLTTEPPGRDNFNLNISVVYQKKYKYIYIMGDIAWIFA